MRKIAVGTVSETKLTCLKEVLDELQLETELRAFEVSSGIPDQPLTSSITKKGSVNRAKHALTLSKDADFGLGIEVGYHPDANGDYEIFCFASIVDPLGMAVSAQSHKMKLPDFHQRILKGNKYLGDHVRQFLADNPDPISQHVGVIIMDRKPFISTAIESVLIYYLQK